VKDSDPVFIKFGVKLLSRLPVVLVICEKKTKNG